MQFEIKIDSLYTEPKVTILTAAVTEEINNLIQRISEKDPQIISGSKNGKLEVLDKDDLFRIYASGGRVFAITENGKYTLRFRLYEIEGKLNPSQFVRISKSEIINLKKVKNFDLSFTGTICVELTNGMTTYVSRRYVSKIKRILGV